MPKFAVPVHWTLVETVIVDTETLQQAIAEANEFATGNREDADTADFDIDEQLVKQLPDDTELPVREYRVDWSIEVSAADPREAAKRALEIQRNPESIANYFDVTGPDGITRPIDLLEESAHAGDE